MKNFKALFAGLKAILNKEGINAKIVHSSQSLKNQSFPLLVFSWGESPLEDLTVKPHIRDCRYIENPCRFNSQISIYAESSLECFTIAQAIIMGNSSELNKQAKAAQAKADGIAPPNINKFSGVTQADSVKADNKFLFHAVLDFETNMVLQFDQGDFPIIGKNRQDKIIAFAQNPQVPADYIYTDDKLSLAYNTTAKIYAVIKPAGAKELWINNRGYELTDMGATAAINNPEDIISATQLSQTVNVKQSDSSWLYTFDTSPSIKVNAQTGKHTITRSIQT